MYKGTALRISLVLFLTAIMIVGIGLVIAYGAEEGKTPEGYEWSSDKGALRHFTKQDGTVNKEVYVFDTYEVLTIGKEKIVSWGIKKPKNLTDLGKDLKGRLMKIDDISAVYVGYRMIMFRKFPLSKWEPMKPLIHKALE